VVVLPEDVVWLAKGEPGGSAPTASATGGVNLASRLHQRQVFLAGAGVAIHHGCKLTTGGLKQSRHTHALFCGEVVPGIVGFLAQVGVKGSAVI
jgi:hypothetical protein